MPTFVALLRGINVGGRNRVPMKPLCAALEAAGLNQVRTYLQSGNMVFASRSAEGSLTTTMEDTIEATCHFRPAVVLRRAQRFRKIAGSHPYLAATDDWTKLQVGFLDGPPDQAAVRNLTLPDNAPEQFKVSDKEVYVYYPNGLARTRVTGQFWETRLQQACTMRNWKTVLALKQLLEDT